MVCHAAHLWWQQRTHRKILCHFFRSWSAHLDSIPIYLTLGGHSERLQLSVGQMPPRHLGYIVWESIPGYRRATWVYHSINRCLLLANEYSTRISHFSARWPCTIKPYLPSPFTHQFGYGQLYMRNLNTSLHFSGNLFEGARAWYFQVARGAGKMFNLPQRTPNAYTSLSFCTWYVIADMVPGYEINASCIKPSRPPIVVIGDTRPFVRKEWTSIWSLRKRLVHMK